MFKSTIFVVVPHKSKQVPQIFGFEINGIDKCPLCGKRIEESVLSRVSGGDDSSAVRWPWHTTIYRIKTGSFTYICGGTLILSRAVITTGKFIRLIVKKTLKITFRSKLRN